MNRQNSAAGSSGRSNRDNYFSGEDRGSRRKRRRNEVEEVRPPPQSTSSADQCHPLLNSVVLRNILQYFRDDPEKLKKLKMVCKQWSKEADSLLYSDCRAITLVKEDAEREEISELLSKIGAYCWLCKLGQPHKCSMNLDTDVLETIKDFLKEPHSHGPRFRKHVLFRWVFKDDHFFPTRKVRHPKTNVPFRVPNLLDEFKFWNVYGPTLTSLKLVECQFPESFYLFDERFLKYVPNLKSLDLENCDIGLFAILKTQYRLKTFQYRHPNLESLRIRYDTKRDLTFAEWKGVFETFRNLKQLKIENGDQRGDSGALLGIIFSDILTPNTALHVNSLDLLNFNFCAAAHLGAVAAGLTFLRSPLVHLRLDLGYLTPFEDISQAINRHASTLRTLHLFRAPYVDPFKTFPCNRQLPNLEELYLWGNVCLSLHFLGQTPRLKVLHWSMSCKDRQNDKLTTPATLTGKFAQKVVAKDKILDSPDFLPKLIVPQLTELALDAPCRKLLSWISLRRIFPNLKKLQLCDIQLTDSLCSTSYGPGPTPPNLEGVAFSFAEFSGMLVKVDLKSKSCCATTKFDLRQTPMTVSPLLYLNYIPDSQLSDVVRCFSQTAIGNVTVALTSQILLHLTKIDDAQVLGEFTVLGSDPLLVKKLKKRRRREGRDAEGDSGVEFLDTLYRFVYAPDQKSRREIKPVFVRQMECLYLT